MVIKAKDLKEEVLAELISEYEGITGISPETFILEIDAVALSEENVINRVFGITDQLGG